MQAITDKEVATILLSIGAVSINVAKPFVYASGLRSPVYCDNRILISYPKRRELICNAFAAAVMDQDIDCIAGTATAGIPHAAWLAQKLSKPMIYVRSKAKSHGKANMIEGLLEPGQRVLLIEDLISTGGSAFAAADAIVAANAKVVQLISIFSYNFMVAQDAIAACNFPVSSLCTLDVLLEVAEQKGFVNSDEIQLLRQWQQDPSAWSQQYEVSH